jgi:hypothetical protein
MSEKPTHVKPGLYAIYYEHMKQIAKEHGYNLVIHGSMHRDLDLIAIPWTDKPKPEQGMIKEFQEYLIGRTLVMPDGNVHFSTLPGGRHCYVIELNRGDKHGEWVRFEDKEYYLDISVTQLPNVEPPKPPLDTIVNSFTKKRSKVTLPSNSNI